jgi:hypothetical protein
MRKTLASALIVFCLLWAQGSLGQTAGEYRTRADHVLVEEKGKGHRESRVKFYSNQSQLLCTVDFSSADGEHGFGVVRATWTPDGKYFVFSLASSGGHQPWHKPTFFYSAGGREFHVLDNFVKAAGISKGDFGLEAPNTIVTEMWQEKSVPVKLALGALLDKHRSQPAVRCSDGKAFDVEAMNRMINGLNE